MRAMAGATGLEPATSGVTGRRSNQLSYAPGTGTSKYGKKLGLSSLAKFFADGLRVGER